MRKNISTLILVLLLGTSCKFLGNANLSGAVITPESEVTEDENQDNTDRFDGIGSIAEVTDSTLKVSWTPDDEAASYDIYNVSSGTPVLIQNISGQNTSSFMVTGLTPGATYKVRVRSKKANGETDSNKKEISVTMEIAPAMPTIVLHSPASSPGTDSTPTFRISGVKSGDEISLFSNSNCTGSPDISSTAAGSTIDLSSSTLTLGAHTFSAYSENINNVASLCTSVTVSYTYNLVCPSGYIPIPGNATLGTTDFCVMKYEAKDDGSGNAVSQIASLPWTGLTNQQAWDECNNLNGGGGSGTYELISNDEWMTIAKNAEVRAENWTNNTIQIGANEQLFVGYVNGAGPLEAHASDEYFGTGASASDATYSGKENKRTLFLDNGESIWDLSGNVAEWIDWEIGGGVLDPPVVTCAAASELHSASCTGLTDVEFKPATPGATSNDDGVGYLYFEPNGMGAIRGGSYVDNERAGLNYLWFNDDINDTRAYVGFRCVYRP